MQLKHYQRFIATLFFKNFLILFLAMQLFFTGIDLMQNLKSLPGSANLQILYSVNIFLNFINYTLPLSLVFAMLSTVIGLIKSNELVSLYALGLSKKRLIAPIFIITTLFTLLYITLNFTPFVKANEISTSIKKHGEVTSRTTGLFLKYFDTYAYIETLKPLQNLGEGITIFFTTDNDIVEILHAKSATFSNQYWNLRDVERIKKPKIASLHQKDAKLTKLHMEKMEVLKGFRPQIIDNLFKGKSQLTIPDSIAAINLLKRQKINTDKIRGNLYLMTLFPLFAPLAVLALFYPLPMQRRGSNLAIVSSGSILAALLLWGILFTLAKITLNGSLKPEWGIAFPMLLLLIATLWIIRRYR
ncbi:MAG: hypothetical protein B6D59_05975 [Campylobacteraceae bacterium 4484_4]|nr:MAG: hypothetical protein B6D59_05975 [Campylobacteraceae bacterium 4484_4]